MFNRKLNREEALILISGWNMKYNFKKNITKAIALTIISTVIFTGCGEKPFAKVNGKEVSQESFDKFLKFTNATAEETYGKEMLDSDMGQGMTAREMIKEQVKEELPKYEAIRQYAEKENIKINEKELKDNLKKFEESYKKRSEAMSKMENEKDNKKDNKDKKEKKDKEDHSFEGFLKKAGLSRSDFEDIFRNEMIRKAVVEHLMKKNTPTEEEIKKYYEENKDNLDTVTASHILVDTEEEAKEISDQIKNGAKFEDFLDRSKDEAAKAQNGNLGEFPRHGAMVEEFSAAAFALNPGEVSDPVKTDFGYHIIKLESKKEGIDALKEDLVKQIKTEKAIKEIEKITKDAKVEYMEKDDKKKDDKKKDDKKVEEKNDKVKENKENKENK